MEMGKVLALCAGIALFVLPTAYIAHTQDRPVDNPVAGALATLPPEPPSIAGMRPIKSAVVSYASEKASEKAPAKTTRRVEATRARSENSASRPRPLSIANRRQLEPKHVAFLLKDAGFSDDAIPKLVCTAKYESMYDTRAKNVNRNGSQDTGLFQINDLWLKECGVTRKQLLDPEVNVACARKVFREQGYWAWYGYRYKQDKCKAFKLKQSTMVALAARSRT